MISELVPRGGATRRPGGLVLPGRPHPGWDCTRSSGAPAGAGRTGPRTPAGLPPAEGEEHVLDPLCYSQASAAALERPLLFLKYN